MSDGSKVITREHLWRALDYLMTDWREAMRSALLNAPAPSIKDEPAKSAAWLSFGFDAANNIYPHVANHRLLHKAPAALTGSILARTALPIWAASELQRYVAERYAAKVDQLNESLFKSHRRLCEEMVDQAQAIALNFGGTDYCAQAMDALEGTLGGRPHDDPWTRDKDIRRIIKDANLVSSDQSEISNQVHAAFAPVAEKVRMMAEASPNRFRQAELWYAPNTDMTWRKTFDGVAYAEYNWQIIRDEAAALKLMAHAHRMEVRQVEGSGLQHRPLRTFVVCRFPNRRHSDFLHDFTNVRGEWESALHSAATIESGEAPDRSRQAS